MNWEVNDLGLDSIDVGAALGVAAEAGLMEWGDCTAAMKLVLEIRAGTEVGKALGDGAAAAGRKFGVERVPVVKGQAMSAYEPRAIKGTGVRHLSAGADHTAGLTITPGQSSTRGSAGRFPHSSIWPARTIGACIFAGFGWRRPGCGGDACAGALWLGDVPDNSSRILESRRLRWNTVQPAQDFGDDHPGLDDEDYRRTIRFGVMTRRWTASSTTSGTSSALPAAARLRSHRSWDLSGYPSCARLHKIDRGAQAWS
jgi:hypothetical protein